VAWHTVALAESCWTLNTVIELAHHRNFTQKHQPQYHNLATLSPSPSQPVSPATDPIKKQYHANEAIELHTHTQQKWLQSKENC